MQTILDTPSPATLDNLALLKNDLDTKIPDKRLEKNLLLASWNIRMFGDITRKEYSEKTDSPKRDFQSILAIAEIIRRFDVIAVQEIRSNLKGLRDTLKLLGNDYSFLLTDVNEGSAGNGERMGFIFDNRRVRPSGLAGELVVPDEWRDTVKEVALKKQFVRSPYAVSFRSHTTTFILVALHIKYGKVSADRIEEIKGIAKWMYNWATDINAYDQNLILLGDFNIDKRGDLLNETFISTGLHIPAELQKEEVTRSLFDETKFYDQIAWFRDKKDQDKISMKFQGGGNYDFLPVALTNRNLTKQQLSFMLSDHYPLWAEFLLSR